MIYWILNIVLLLGITFLAFRFGKGQFSEKVFFSALTVRMSAAVAASLVFIYVYKGSDSIYFFELAKSMLAKHSVLEILTNQTEQLAGVNPRVAFFSKALSIFTFIAGENYWIVSLHFGLIGFLSSWYFVRVLTELFPSLEKVVIVSFLFLPSVTFWSSGILKDTFAFAAVLLAIIPLLRLYKSYKPKVLELLFSISSLWVLFGVKHYLLITLLIFAALLLGISMVQKLKGWKRWVSIIVPISLLLATQFIHPYLKVHRIANTIYETNQVIIEKTPLENQIGIIVESASWSSILSEAPQALFTALFRPTIFDQVPTIGLIHQLENLVLLSLFVFSLLILVKERPKLDLDLLMPSIICIAMLSTLLALTTPNLGTLVRYRNAFFPFLFLLSSILPYQFLTSKKD